MTKLKQNFYLEIKDTEQIVASEFQQPTATWDKKIPVVPNANLEIHTSVSNGKIFEYKTEVIFYTKIENAQNSNNVSNNVAIVASAKFSHHPNANTLQLVMDLFPQYFTE